MVKGVRLSRRIAVKLQHSMPTNPSTTETAIVRHGAVAVILRQERLLMIRRSQHVIAPGMYCFPGGGIEPGETQQQAVVRELQEELSCTVRPLRWLWEGVSSWGVHLTWWLSELDETAELAPNPAEVESVHWFTLEELKTLPNQLESNYRFLEAVGRGEVQLTI
jgi:8-oxo-dGTP diphosphatase